MAQTSFKLLIMSGSDKGREYAVNPDVETVLGRSSQAGLTIPDEVISRRHARIESIDGELWIHDLESTNGTFVNGTQIASARLSEGDRILLGSTMIKVVSMEDMEARHIASVLDVGPRAGLDVSVEGSLSEVSVADLLQLFSVNSKTGVLYVEGEGGRGSIHLRGGGVRHAAIEGRRLVPLKALFRMLAWMEGNFQLVNEEPPPGRKELDLDTNTILLEGFRHNADLAELIEKHALRDRRLFLRVPLVPPLSDLSGDELDTVQLIVNFGTIEEVMDRCRFSDCKGYQTVVDLIRRSYVIVQ